MRSQEVWLGHLLRMTTTVGEKCPGPAVREEVTLGAGSDPVTVRQVTLGGGPWRAILGSSALGSSRRLGSQETA